MNSIKTDEAMRERVLRRIRARQKRQKRVRISIAAAAAAAIILMLSPASKMLKSGGTAKTDLAGGPYSTEEASAESEASNASSLFAGETVSQGIDETGAGSEIAPENVESETVFESQGGTGLLSPAEAEDSPATDLPASQAGADAASASGQGGSSDPAGPSSDFGPSFIAEGEAGGGVAAGQAPADFGETPASEEIGDVSQKYAYSMGTADDSGDFIINVDEAGQDYAVMGANSYTAVSPDYNYLAGEGPDGLRITSQVLYFSGRGSSDTLELGSVNLTTGVNDPSAETPAVGLSNYDLEGVELMSFAGCRSAEEGTENLVETAHENGVQTAVGFRDEIDQRQDDGKLWLRIYNQSLANGYSVVEALNRANTASPCSNLKPCVRYSGDGQLHLNSLSSEAAPLTYDEVKVAAADLGTNIPAAFEFTHIDISGKDLAPDTLYDFAVSNGFFNPQWEYTVEKNIYCEEENTGYIELARMIGSVKTSDRITGFFEKDRMTDIVTYVSDVKSDLSEKEILKNKTGHNILKEAVKEAAGEAASVEEKHELFYDLQRGSLFEIVRYVITFKDGSSDMTSDVIVLGKAGS